MGNVLRIGAGGRQAGPGALLHAPVLAVLLAICLLIAAMPSAHAEEQILGVLHTPVSVPARAPLADPRQADAQGELDRAGLANLAGRQAGTGIASIRLGDQAGQTRFVIELDGDAAANFRVFTLPDPYRVVIDLPGAPSRLPEGAASQKGRGFVISYRYGQFKDDTFRIVIDATGPVTVAQSFVLEPQGGFGRRIVLDLAASDRESFLRIAALPDAPAAAKPDAPLPVRPPVPEPPSAPAAMEIPPMVPLSPATPREHRRIVVIDPGHGGIDPGTHGSSGVLEKDVVLAFARELASRLRGTGRYDVHMTRDKDVFIPLRERVQIARRHKADLFISIHADSIHKNDVRGMSVYTLSEKASDKEAAELARKENLSDAIAGINFQGESPEVAGILIDLAQRETKNYSARFAKSVVDYARPATTLLEPTHRFAGFVVLKAPDVPSVLVELGFLTNSHDEKRLTSPKWRNTVSASFVRAIDHYFGDRLAEGGN